MSWVVYSQGSRRFGSSATVGCHYPGRHSTIMIQQPPPILAYVHAKRAASTIGPRTPRRAAPDTSVLVQAVTEQRFAGSNLFAHVNTLFEARRANARGYVPFSGPSGRFETTILAGSADFETLIDFPDWTAQVFMYAGLCLLLLGLMAWFSSHRLKQRAWGRRLVLSGGGLFVVGSAWSTFVNLLRYVLG